MFLERYGLREQPFGVTPNPRYLYPAPSHREVLASLVYGIESDLGFAALVASPGMGKTTLLFYLLEKFRDSARTAFVFQTQCTAADLLRQLGRELELPNGNDIVRLQEELASLLVEESRAGRRVLIIVDEAQNLDTNALETLRLLSNFETTENKLLHIILAGQPQLAEKLARPELDQLQQRLAMINRLAPLTTAEVGSYIEHRLNVAGYRGAPLFTADAVQVITRTSSGVPRKINRICFNALSLGCALGKPKIDGAVVQEVATDLDLRLPQKEDNEEESTRLRPVTRTATMPFAHKTESAASASAKSQPAQPATPTNANAVKTVVPLPTAASQPSAAAPIRTSPIPAATVRPAAIMPRNEARPQQLQPAAGRPRRSLQPGLTFIALGVVVVMLLAGAVWTYSGQGASPGAQPAASSDPHPEGEASARSREAPQNPTAVDPSNTDAQNVSADDSARPPQPRPAEQVQAPPQQNPSLKPADEAGDVRTLEEQALARSAGPAVGSSSAQSSSNPADNQRNEPAPPPQIAPDESGTRALVASMLKAAPAPMLASPPPARAPLSSAVEGGELLSKVSPNYPSGALARGVEGTVVLSATVDRDGKVRNVRPLSGNALLVQAAIDAVRQWRYRPYVLNGKPLDMQTQISIRFRLPEKGGL